MRTILLILCTLCVSCFLRAQTNTERKAITIVPVADLLSQSLTARNTNTKTDLTYDSIPISGQYENKACPRLHQLIYNETVTVLEEVGDEVKVNVPNHFCQQEGSPLKQSNYWTAKKNIITFDELKKLNINQNSFPKPISYANPNTSTKDTITLGYPFKSDFMTFSAGTRFVKISKQSDNNAVSVYAFNPKSRKQEILVIPKNLIIPHHNKPHEKIDEYIKLIRSWAQTPQGVIPYVWGGCSVISFCKNQPYVEKKDIDAHPFYSRTDRNKGVQNGLDCSGLILRGTQLCGIPYYYKNSTTLAKNLLPLKKNQAIENGDIIWFPGHVIVVSDVKNNLVVEARGYEHGYGIVQETPLNEQFKNIITYADLVKAFHEKRPLARLNKSGEVVKTLTNYKILTLKSVWQLPKNNK